MILFSKQYGEVVVIVTESRVIFQRDTDGFVMCMQVDPQHYEEIVGAHHDSHFYRPAESH
jgi:hypothetical protein